MKKKRKSHAPIEPIELVHPTLREKMPSETFKKIVRPIDETSLYKLEKMARQAIWVFIWRHGRKRLTTGQRDHIIFDAIDSIWGAADLPPDEYQYIHFTTLQRTYKRPQRTFWAGFRKKKPIPIIGGPTKTPRKIVLPRTLENRRRITPSVPTSPAAKTLNLFPEEKF